MFLNHTFLFFISVAGLALLCRATVKDPEQIHQIYRAPLHGMEELDVDVDHDHYIVVFKQGYELGAHWRYIGLDLSQSPFSQFVHQHLFDSYTAKMVRMFNYLSC